jgi:hypothetical protein
VETLTAHVTALHASGAASTCQRLRSFVRSVESDSGREYRAKTSAADLTAQASAMIGGSAALRR